MAEQKEGVAKEAVDIQACVCRYLDCLRQNGPKTERKADIIAVLLADRLAEGKICNTQYGGHESEIHTQTRTHKPEGSRRERGPKTPCT